MRLWRRQCNMMVGKRGRQGMQQSTGRSQQGWDRRRDRQDRWYQDKVAVQPQRLTLTTNICSLDVSRQKYRDRVKEDATLYDVWECIYHLATHYRPESRPPYPKPLVCLLACIILYFLRTSCVLSLHLVDGLSSCPLRI